MEEITVKGIILEANPQGEYGRRVVLLSDRLGKLTAFAQGAAKSNSKIIGAIRPMTAAAFTLAKGRGGYNIHGVEVMEAFAELPMDPDASLYAFYVLELGSWFSAEGMPEDEAKTLLNLMYMTLAALQKKALSEELVRRILELKLLVLSGEYTEYPMNREPAGAEIRTLTAALWHNVIVSPLSALYDPQRILPEEIRDGGTALAETCGEDFGSCVEYLFKKQVNHKFRSLQILRDLE